MPIRPARPEDMPAVGRLAAGLVAMHHAMDPRFMTWDNVAEGYAHWLGKELRRPKRAVVLVATQRRKIVGYAYGGIEDTSWKDLLARSGWLHDVFVDESARGNGIGEALVEGVVQKLRDLGAPRVVLISAWKNEGAQKLFEKLGFRRTAVEMTRDIR